jgi:hypothetical protein
VDHEALIWTEEGWEPYDMVSSGLVTEDEYRKVHENFQGKTRPVILLSSEGDAGWEHHVTKVSGPQGVIIHRVSLKNRYITVGGVPARIVLDEEPRRGEGVTYRVGVQFGYMGGPEYFLIASSPAPAHYGAVALMDCRLDYEEWIQVMRGGK